jgi:hypothetical protein
VTRRETDRASVWTYRPSPRCAFDPGVFLTLSLLLAIGDGLDCTCLLHAFHARHQDSRTCCHCKLRAFQDQSTYTLQR